MAYFRLEQPQAEAKREVAAMPKVEVQQIHPEWYIVLIRNEAGEVEDVKRKDNLREAVELAQNLALLGIGEFDGRIQEVRALVA